MTTNGRHRAENKVVYETQEQFDARMAWGWAQNEAYRLEVEYKKLMGIYVDPFAFLKGIPDR